MGPIESRLAAARAARHRIEAVVRARNPVETSVEGLVPYLMTEKERRRWHAIDTAITELSKYL
jgi:hypothetical protein